MQNRRMKFIIIVNEILNSWNSNDLLPLMERICEGISNGTWIEMGWICDRTFWESSQMEPVSNWEGSVMELRKADLGLGIDDWEGNGNRSA